jgi:N-acetyl-anhydromuramyl-L-alanine amidase AmpD
MISPEAQLNQLTEQQAAITRALSAMTEARWTGEDSVEAWLLALDPTFVGTLHPQQPRYQAPPSEIESPQISWIGSPNYWPGHGGFAVRAIVLHTMAGTLASCDAWFKNQGSQVSAHFGIGLEGDIHQYVALSNSAWANGILEPGNTWPLASGSPNYQTISIETEDNGIGSTLVSEAQFESSLQVANLAVQTYPTIKWLLRHTDISPQSRPSCCGPRWTDSGRFRAIADKLGLQTTF